MFLVFSDDWGRHPSSCQHLVRRLLNERGTFYFGGMPQEMALRNIRLFAQEVMPALQETNA